MLAIVTNPLVLACALGIGLSLAGIALPAAASGTLDIMGKAALGLGLLCVGASLKWSSLVESRWPIGGAALVKLVGLPLLAGLACHMLGVGGVERSVVVLFAALPASPAAYVLARQMGGNAEMMAGIITATTPLAMVTIPVALALLA
jgi:predicted permease